jgi:hypothetical protein
MSPVIRIPSEIYARLEQHARGFDTPANVIETLLNHYDGVVNNSSGYTTDVPPRPRDSTKYFFNNHEYGKGRLVLAVIKDYVSSNSNTSFDNLTAIFPKHLQGSIGVFSEHDYVLNKYIDKNHKRHFLKQNELIQLSDCVIAVSTEWGAANIDDFIQQAEALGYKIIPTND